MDEFTRRCIQKYIDYKDRPKFVSSKELALRYLIEIDAETREALAECKDEKSQKRLEGLAPINTSDYDNKETKKFISENFARVRRAVMSYNPNYYRDLAKSERRKVYTQFEQDHGRKCFICEPPEELIEELGELSLYLCGVLRQQQFGTLKFQLMRTLLHKLDPLKDEQMGTVFGNARADLLRLEYFKFDSKYHRMSRTAESKKSEESNNNLNILYFEVASHLEEIGMTLLESIYPEDSNSPRVSRSGSRMFEDLVPPMYYNRNLIKLDGKPRLVCDKRPEEF